MMNAFCVVLYNGYNERILMHVSFYKTHKLTNQSFAILNLDFIKKQVMIIQTYSIYEK